MTDNETIKALECCGHQEPCENCPCGDWGGIDRCIHSVMQYALELINRQKAEIEALQSVNAELQESLRLAAEVNKDMRAEVNGKSDKTAAILPIVADLKKEAVKEFAEKLKEAVFECDVSFGYGREHYTEAVAVIEIDRLVKEMAGGEK